MRKYLFFFLNPTIKMKIQEDTGWKWLSFVGFQSVLWWWPGQWCREVFASSHASESQYKADSGSISKLCCRAGRALLIHFHTKWRKVPMALASSVSGDVPSPPLFLPPTSKANMSCCGVFFSILLSTNCQAPQGVFPCLLSFQKLIYLNDMLGAHCC